MDPLIWLKTMMVMVDLEEENPLDDYDMQVNDRQQWDKPCQQGEDEARAPDDADQVCIKYRVIC